MPAGLGPRKGDRLTKCREALDKWRQETWYKNHRFASWDYCVLLPDDILQKLASCANILTAQALRDASFKWDFAQKYDEDILQLLKPIDDAWNEERQQEKNRKAVERKVQSQANAVQRQEDRRQKQFEETERKRSRTSPQAFNLCWTKPIVIPGPAEPVSPTSPTNFASIVYNSFCSL